jgi:lantibiotic modifying enzyme
MNNEHLEIAARLAGRLCRDAVWSRGLCNWTGDRPEGNAAPHGALVPQLYSGTSGIALALWRIGDATGDSIIRSTAEGAIACALSRMPVAGCGFYTGGLGILYAAAEIRGEVDRAAVLKQAATDRATLDIIAGSAGAMATLIDFHRRAGGDELIELAIRHGDLLREEAVREAEGWSWNTLPGVQGQTGFSHGAAGISWALLELWRATGEARFREAAREGFRFERACFDAQRCNWADFRGGEADYQSVWCHGSGGIALSRLRAWKMLGDDELLAEARVALEDVRRALPRLENFSLCHGVAGCADLFIEAAHVLGEPCWLDVAEEAARWGIERYERPRRLWPGGMHRMHETPDLMWGTAGIAWFYLRMADKGLTHTILAPPC